MKVVVSCDAIINRDYYLEIIETILDQVGEEVELYTLIHNQGSVLGHVEMRKIHASYLTNIAKNWESLLQNSFLVPSSCKKLFIPCRYDLIINISRGFSQGIKKCENTKMLTYLVEDIQTIDRDKSLKEKIFQPFVKKFQMKSLSHADDLWVSDPLLVNEKLRERAKVVAPPVKLSDYRILPDSLIPNDYFLINSESLGTELASDLLRFYSETGYKFKFVGRDSHLDSLINSLNENDKKYFFGDKCSGELAPLLGGAKFLIDFEKNKVPTMSLKAMACGRPVYSKGNRFLEHGQGHYLLEKVYFEGFDFLQEFESKKVRGRALGFDELKFKHILRRYLDATFVTRTPYNVEDSCC